YESLTVNGYTRHLKDMRADRRTPAAGEIAYLVGRYDEEIRRTDHELARLRERLDARGFDDHNTVLVVTADHGEEFGDHGQMLHGHSLFDEQIRVPLVMRGPRIPSDRRVGSQVQMLDVTATLLDLAGVLDNDAADESAALDGSTLLPAFEGGALPSRPALAFLLTHYVALRTPEWKLVV